MSNDRLLLTPDAHTDHIDPSYIASLASRIYNEFPSAGEVPRSESDARNFNPPSVPNSESVHQQVDRSTPIPLNIDTKAPSQADIDVLDLSVFGLNNQHHSALASVPSDLDLKNFYFFPDGVPDQQEPLSSHTNNLVSQQSFKGNEGVNNDLGDFVKKVQSVSGGFGQSGKPNPSTKPQDIGRWNDGLDFNFFLNPLPQEQAHAHEPHPDFYFLKQSAPLLHTDIFDVQSIRRDFPILHQQIHGKQLVWFDNAATTQKPQIVIDTLSRFYSHDNSNIHRAAHTLAARSTDAYEGAREKVRTFIGAASTEEVIFVRGTTEAINLVAQTWGRQNIRQGDEILISLLEHHANIVPWQMLAKEKGATLKAIPVNDSGEILMDEYERLLNPRVKLLAVTQASNGLGTVLPVKEMIQLAKRYDIKVLVDGAQSVAHIPVNVQELNTDFFVFSGHKIFSPNGIGVVYGRKEILESMPPWQGGGNMIKDVRLEETIFNGPPNKFEAGTPNVADAIGLGVALDYVSKIGLANIARYEHELTEYGTQRLLTIPGLRLIGTAKNKVGVLSFVLPNIPTEQVGKYLDQEGIAVRAGHHCTQPSLRRFGVESTVRPSLAFYNTKEEIDRLVEAVRRLQYRQI